MPLSRGSVIVSGTTALAVPFQYPNMFAYWNPKDATLSGSEILTIPNTSGTGTSARNLARSGGVGPLYNATDANFNGKPSAYGTTAAVRRMSSTFETSMTQPYTIYMAMRVEVNTDTAYWRSNGGNFGNSAGFFIDSNRNTHMLTADSTGRSITTPVIAAGNYINCSVYDYAGGVAPNGAGAIYYNNSTTPSATYPGDGSIDANNCAVMTIGSFGAGSLVNYSWATIICYNGAHNQATRAAIMSYLGTQFGITTT